MRALGPFFLMLLLASAGAAAAAEPVHGFIEVDGGRLYYEEQGEGPPLVLLHDGLVSSAGWDDSFRDFARLYRVVRYDRRGFGRSDPPKGPFSPVDDLQALFTRLGLGRAVLVGCSNGSRLAVDFTLAHPESVQALVLVGPVVSGIPYSEHFTRRGLVNFRPMFQEKSLEKTVESWVRDPYLTAPGDTRAKARLRELLLASPGPVTGVVGIGRDPERPAATRLGEIQVPTLIVVGAADIPDVHAQAGVLENGIHGARRVIVPDAGHLVPLEKPAELDEFVLAFLRPGDEAAAHLATLAGDRLWEEGRKLFDYDRDAPLDVRAAGTETRGNVRVIDLSYASPLGGRVPAFLVLPAGAGKSPGVLFLHPGQGDRSTFVDEAVGLARRGLVSLSIGAPFTREGYKDGAPWDPEADRREAIQTVVDLRRGFDLLAARPEVDPARLGYVGHSLGATLGGILPGIETRVKAYVLMAGYVEQTWDWAHGHHRGHVAFRTLLTPEQQQRYLAALAPLDAIHYITRPTPARLLFQFARRDEFISPGDAELYLQAARGPKEVQWYDTDHFFNDEARARRDDWLVEALGAALGAAGKE